MSDFRGVLPDHKLTALFEDGSIASQSGPDVGQIQPASLDLRLGDVAYRVRASFLPGRNRSVQSV